MRMGREFIGVFDSGVGGLTVVGHIRRLMPHEDVVFYGDSANAPYGERTRDAIVERSREITASLVREGAKAIVVACNTATSAAAPTLRAEFPDVPIIGLEPAVKPAALAPRHGRILVMATDVTLSGTRFRELASRYASSSEIIAAPCPGLAARIERGDLDAPDVEELVRRLVGRWSGSVDSVVLGCTHYPFVRRQIAHVMGNVPMFDGGEGTARQTRRLLAGRLRGEGTGRLTLRSSVDTDDERTLYRELLARLDDGAPPSRQ